MGDAVLELVVSAGLFNEYTHEDEGVLTRYRANLVCKDALSAWGTSMEIPRLVRLGKGLVHQGANASIIADASEAVFGAVFFDGGYEAASQVILRYLFFSLKVMRMMKNKIQSLFYKKKPKKEDWGNLNTKLYHQKVLLICPFLRCN